MQKQIRRILSAAMAGILALSLCACGEKSNNTGAVENGKQTWYLGGKDLFSDSKDAKEYFEGVEDTIDPASIYSSVTITEKMLYGAYTLNNKEKDLKKVRQEIPFQEVSFEDGAWNMTVLPVAVYFGKDNISSSETRYSYSDFEEIDDAEVAVIVFALEEQVGQLPCVYEVNGRTITFKQITKTSTGEEPFAYDYTGFDFTYDFSICGPYLTLSNGDASLKLKAFCLTENVESDLRLYGYSLPDSPLVDELDYFSASDFANYAVRRNGSYYDSSAYKMTDDGIFTVYLEEDGLNVAPDEVFMNQYAYIIQSSANSFFTSFGIILLDGSREYYYTDDITMREARVLEEQGADVGALTDEQIEAIAQKRADLFDDLQSAFEAQGIQVTINRSMGEIALDSSVLFDVSQSDISEEGKVFLQKFMAAYTSVAFGEKYDQFVSRIMVEGHTDTTGDYDMNMALSLARADSVKAYCLSEESGVDAAQLAILQQMLESVGYSYDKPVYDKDGKVDMAASRRVSFRFIINLEQVD